MSDEPSPKPKDGRGSILRGVLIALAVVILGTGLNVFLFEQYSDDYLGALWPIIAFSLFQFVYLVPLALLLRRQRETLKGMAIIAGTAMLLNAACFGIAIAG